VTECSNGTREEETKDKKERREFNIQVENVVLKRTITPR